MRIKAIIKQLTPPLLFNTAKRLVKGARQPFSWKSLSSFKTSMTGDLPEWEYIPEGWDYATTGENIEGWNHPSIREAYRTKWRRFQQSTEGPGPLGISPECPEQIRDDLTFHNINMSFAYCLGVASRGKTTLAMLDWGGGIGHFVHLAKVLYPDLNITYSCKDMPLLADIGPSYIPDGRFYTDDSCFEKQYDFTFASGSLHYSEDWQSVLRKIFESTNGYVFVTCLPTVLKAKSFVYIQRPYAFGYMTEYIGWCLNKTEFIEAARACGASLVREFVVGHAPYIVRAPEQNAYRGFLFKTKSQTPTTN
ncbi:MAG: hypothetical protein ACFCD0_09855 [Gemmataceae bacterium]